MTPEESTHPSVPVCHPQQLYPTISLTSVSPLAASAVISAEKVLNKSEINEKRQLALTSGVLFLFL